MIRKYSAVTLAAFSLVGCAAPSGSTPESTTPADSVPSSGLAKVVTPAGERVVRYHLEGTRVLSGADEHIGNLGQNALPPMHTESISLVVTVQQWPKTTMINVPFNYGVEMTAGQINTFNDVVNAGWNATGFVNLYYCPSCTGDRLVINPTTQDSFVGRLGGEQAQACNVGNIAWYNADDLPSILSINHQLGHALGLFHEQQRWDRAWFVQYVPDMIVGADNTSLIAPAGSADFGMYDFRSVMQMTSTDLEYYRWGQFPEDGLLKTDGTQITRSSVPGNDDYHLTNGDKFGLHEAYFGDPSYQGDVVVSLSRGSRFKANGGQTAGGGLGWSPAHKVIDDFVGARYSSAEVDGRNGDDLIAISPGTFIAGTVQVSTSDRGGFPKTAVQSPIPANFCMTEQTCTFLDVNGDGMADILSWDTNHAQLVLATGGGAFSATVNDLGGPGCPSGSVCTIANVTGTTDNTRAPDFVRFTAGVFEPVYPGVGSGSALRFPSTTSKWTFWNNMPPLSSMTVRFADLNGDGYVDPVLYNMANGNLYSYVTNAYYVGYFNSAGTTLTFQNTANSLAFLLGDVTGDGYPDAVLVTNGILGNVWIGHGNGYGWFMEDNTSQYTSNLGEMPYYQFAQSSLQSFVLGDFDKDGYKKMDIAKFNNNSSSPP